MPRFFTHYWVREQNRKSEEIFMDHTAGNVFQKRGIQVGDTVYVVSLVKGALYVFGKLVVGKICDTDEAATILDYEAWPADEHIIAAAGTPMNFNLRVPLKTTRQLRFISGKGSKPLKFKAQNYLDEQTIRGVRELDPVSATELDALLPPLEEISFDDEGSEFPPLDEETFPEEVVDAQTYYEGATNILR